MTDVEGQLLAHLNDHQTIANSAEYAASQHLEHGQVVGVTKSLQASGLVEAEVRSMGNSYYLYMVCCWDAARP